MCPKVTVEHEQHQREKILQAATACFCRRGFHRTTIQDICEEAGLSKGGLYTYFQSKEEILAVVVEHSFMEGLQQAEAAAQNGESAPDKLDRVAAAVIERQLSSQPHAAQSPQLLLEIWAEASKNPQMNALCAGAYERWRGFLSDLLRQGMASGQIKADVDADALAAILVAIFDGLSLQEGITRARVDWWRVTSTLRQGLGAGIFTQEASAPAQPGSVDGEAESSKRRPHGAAVRGGGARR